jgi:hypothetical protein
LAYRPRRQPTDSRGYNRTSISALNQDEQTIVVVPSITIEFDVKGAEMQAYEERFLFLLLLLRQPRAG